MKMQIFILGIALVFLYSCTGEGGYQRHYIISDTSQPLAGESSR